MAFEWSDELSVGNATIDSEHRHLISIANEVVSAIRTRDCPALASAFLHLERWLCIHFMNEEYIARAVNFDVSGHKPVQQYLLTELRHLSDELISKDGVWSDHSVEHFAEYMENWVINEHILRLDMQMKPALQAYDYNFMPG